MKPIDDRVALICEIKGPLAISRLSFLQATIFSVPLPLTGVSGKSQYKSVSGCDSDGKSPFQVPLTQDTTLVFTVEQDV